MKEPAVVESDPPPPPPPPAPLYKVRVPPPAYPAKTEYPYNKEEYPVLADYAPCPAATASYAVPEPGYVYSNPQYYTDDWISSGGGAYVMGDFSPLKMMCSIYIDPGYGSSTSSASTEHAGKVV